MIIPQDFKQKLNKPIVFIGMMGAGKSYVARALSQMLDLPCYDSDNVIEEKAGCTIAQIFEDYGEEKFRDVEKRTILELLESGTNIIATGGGAVKNPETLEALKEKSILIWLDADSESLFERVSKNTSRPLLQTANPREKLENLLKERRPLYAQAHITFDTSREKEQKPRDIVLQDMLKTINDYLEKL